MAEMTYLSRLCDKGLQIALQSSGAVLIEGAKWCGKTRTASIAAKSILYMQALARNVATVASIQTIKSDIEATDVSISDKTISSYLNALRRIFVVEDLPAWLPSMRSKPAIRTSAKRHFVDPSIATAVLRTNPKVGQQTN